MIPKKKQFDYVWDTKHAILMDQINAVYCPQGNRRVPEAYWADMPNSPGRQKTEYNPKNLFIPGVQCRKSQHYVVLFNFFYG